MIESVGVYLWKAVYGGYNWQRMMLIFYDHFLSKGEDEMKMRGLCGLDLFHLVHLGDWNEIGERE